MSTLALIVGVVVAAFVGFNVGGSSTGVAFGPAVGSGVLTKLSAGLLMSAFFLLGGWTIGRRVVDTLGNGLVVGGFTLFTGVVVLLFIGLALFASNVVGVPASTSMTAVGAIAGLGLAKGTLRVPIVLEIVGWWLVAPVVGFWVSAVIGRYRYTDIADRLAITESDGPLLTWTPIPRPGPGTNRRELAGATLVAGIGCYMAFSAGASNVANAVAPLVGSGSLSMNGGILLAAAATGVGALTIARRTLDTMGNDLTELPLAAALVVAVVSSTLVTVLSVMGIPASFVVIATMSIVGLGWGRATRADVSGFPDDPTESPAALGAPVQGADAPGAIDPDSAPTTAELYRPATTLRVVVLQNVVPGLATVGAYLAFTVL